MLTDHQESYHWPVYNDGESLNYSQSYQVPNSTYGTMEIGQVVPNYNFELDSTQPVEVPQYYSPDHPYQTESAHRVSVIGKFKFHF